MPNAARVGDPCSHPGAVTGPGRPDVLIENKPAAVQGDQHTCAMPPNAGPHPVTPFAKGSLTVQIGSRGALRMGDTAGCGSQIVSGALSVQIGG